MAIVNMTKFTLFNVYSGFLDMAGRYLLLGRAAHDGRPQSRKTTPHPHFTRCCQRFLPWGVCSGCRLVVMAYKRGIPWWIPPLHEICSAPFPCFADRSRWREKIRRARWFYRKIPKFITRTWRANFDSIELYKPYPDKNRASCHR